MDRTWLCSVVFMDIAAYWSQSVELQMKWKLRFNGYLAEAIHDVPEATVTGCITSTGSGMSVTDEKDKRIYPLSGNPGVVKSGHRMTLEGERRGKIFEARSVIMDFGACH